jgi:signal transduction histidine kinase
LLLASSAVVIVLRDYQQRARLDQLGDLSFPILAGVRSLEERGATPRQIVSLVRLQSEMLRVRIILADQNGRVLEDTGNELDGTVIRLPSGSSPERQARTSHGPYYASTEGGLFLIAPSTRLDDIAGFFSKYAVILAVPQATVAQAWWELAPSLSIAAAISLVVSILAALVLARSISRPLLRMTRASEEMARGRYEQSIVVRGRDEIARLASAFNAMARQVSSSDRTMRDFLANVSHELKTPLTSIQGFSQAMLDGVIRGDEQFHNAAGIINEETQAMRRLVDDLLTLSKIESGQISMQDEQIEIDRVLRDVVRRGEWAIEASRLQVNLEANSLAAVRGDAHWLTQVFSNLFDNAIKHTPAFGRLDIQAHVRAQPAEVQVSFRNSGSLIPAEDLPRVFERFFQVDRSRSARVHGSGLGLAIVREVVQSHGGSVAAESEPARGTTFTVRLPLAAIVEREGIVAAPTSQVA